MELIHAYHGSRTVTTEDFESLVGEAISEQGPSTSDGLGFLRCLRMNLWKQIL